MNSKYVGRFFKSISIFVITCMVLGCRPDLGLLQIFQPTPITTVPQSSQDLPLAMVKFEAINLQDSQAPGNLTIEILDEVTGLALNPQRYPMSQEAPGVFSTEIAFPLGSTIKYRYLRGDYPYVVEYTTTGAQVRYRMVQVNAPSIIQDIIAAWTDIRYQGPTGRVKGQVVNPENNTPIPSGLVVAGGFQTLTASDGTFLIEGLPPGVHNLVVYSLDGSYETFQQGALVAENATTPAFIQARIAPLVDVTFVVQAPEANIKGLPLRIVGNLYNLGNTFADLEGGISVVAARAPLMSMVTEGFYTITLKLPAGFDLRYKYTLGDGFWNAEHAAGGGFVTRQLIVPTTNTTITDVIETWQSGEQQPITFLVNVPPETISEDSVSIQFSPYGWTNPIPMWPVGNNRWLYVLYSPLNMVGNVTYRYCRNDQCGVADGLVAADPDQNQLTFTPGAEPQVIQDTVSKWVGWNFPGQPLVFPDVNVPTRGDTFIAGVELSPQYTPLWQPYQFWGINRISLLGANWVIISPTWQYTRTQPPVIEPVTGASPLWFDTAQTIQTARQNGLNPALFPRLGQKLLNENLWSQPNTDPAWWQNWFERYKIFILNYADLANQTNTPFLVLGGPDVLPALPDGILPDGEPSGVPALAEEKWVDIIESVRGRYHGALVWAVPFPFNQTIPPTLLNQVDIIYILYSAPLVDEYSGDINVLIEKIKLDFDQDIYPIYASILKPIVIGLNYPSAKGAASGCIPEGQTCLEFEHLVPPIQNHSTINVDLDIQRDIYHAALMAVNDTEWIAGVVSRGYYTPVPILDSSTSIHGKPASEVVWNWFTRLLGR